MTVLEWIRKNPGEKYNIFIYKDYCRTYVPYQNDYRLIYDMEIVETHQVKSHKLIWDKKLLMMVPDKPSYNIYIR